VLNFLVKLCNVLEWSILKSLCNVRKNITFFCYAKLEENKLECLIQTSLTFVCKAQKENLTVPCSKGENKLSHILRYNKLECLIQASPKFVCRPNHT
jgi:hypothetical protein